MQEFSIFFITQQFKLNNHTAALDKLKSAFRVVAQGKNEITKARFHKFMVNGDENEQKAFRNLVGSDFEVLDIDKQGSLTFDELITCWAMRQLRSRERKRGRKFASTIIRSLPFSEQIAASEMGRVSGQSSLSFIGSSSGRSSHAKKVAVCE